MSDQDFFFDEEEKPAEKQASAASKSSAKQTSGASKSSAKQPAKSAPQPSSGMELTWTVTALIAIVALLVGVIVGYTIPKSSSTADTATSTSTSAPQLSPEQMQSGQLPAGHPAIGGSGSSATSTTP